MKKLNHYIKRIFLIFLLIIPFVVFAQSNNYEKIQINEKLQSILKDSINRKVITYLDTLFFHIANENIDHKIIKAENIDLTSAVLKGLQGIKSFKNDTKNLSNYKKQLIKFYPISENIYSVSVALVNTGNQKAKPFLKTIFRLIAEYKNGNVQFSIPIRYITKKWKSTIVGNITYFYKDTIQLHRARKFNNKNNIIAEKFNAPVEQFKFYMCENYQEILELLGYEYQLESASTYNLGYGVEEGYIFSIMNNEDFSHDIFHYYSGKINNSNDRNWIAEEGIACSWGNAYYTDKYGEMIELSRLIGELKTYLQHNKNTSLLHLFENNTKIFSHIAPDLSVRSVISGVICNEIEDKKGIDGIIKIINSGRKPNSIQSYFNTLHQLIAIDKANFNHKVSELLKVY